MGVYNPNIPTIVGQEWVPIREEDTTFSPAVNVVELGHSFTVTAPRRIQDARFYVNEMPPLTDRGQTYLAAVYRKGTEKLSGPVQRVVIPANQVQMTGGTVSGAATAVAALLTQSTASGISLNTSLANSGLVVNWAVNQYPNLTGKRILGVNLLLGGSGTSDIFGAGSASASAIFMAQNASVVPLAPFALFGRFGETLQITRHKFGEINQFWTAGVAPISPTSTSQRMPWTYTQLTRLDNLAGVLYTLITTGTAVNTGTIAGSSFAFIFYAALEVFFCEEQRVAVGAEQFGTTFSSASLGKDTILGVNTIALVDMPTLQNATSSTGAVQPTLQPDDYTLVLSSADVGALNDNLTATTSDFSQLNALRELYAMPNQPGVQVELPFPMDETAVGDVFTATQTHVLPQLSMHTSGGPVGEVHVYGRQAAAQVYGSITATQWTLGLGSGSATYPWVRFYARRFGNTTVPLTLESPTITGNPSLSVSISPADFDELDEIIDGWKEITLRISSPPVLNASEDWRWRSTGELVGNRWEILGAIAPALSGTPAGLYTQVVAAQRLGPATYGQPAAGASTNMAWIPGYAPPVTTTTDDESADGVIMFSQDPAPVSGFSISQLNLPLSGIGIECVNAPEFIPTALAYNQLTWSLDPVTQLSDVFARVVSNGWGSATSGQAWTASGGVAANFNVANGVGTVALTTTSAYRITRAATFSQANVNAYAEIWANQAASVADHWGSLFVRDNGSGDHLYGEINFATDGTVLLILTTVSGGVHTVLGTVTFAHTYTPGTRVKLRLQTLGSSFKGKAWIDGDVEPDDWLLEVSTPTNLVAGFAGTRSIVGGGAPTTTVISYDNILVAPITMGYTEIQRMDTLTDWKTIMKATDQSVQVFNDYEARVGLLTSYRIRKVNTYGFVGSWSATITNTIAAPGVTAIGLGANDHVWIFTTNSVQSGTSNLAYALGWDGEVNEDFNFPEAGGQTFQTMYGRDYVTVFRPSERGGTNFSRSLLIQAAAIVPETLEDFTSLRDMAWIDVPYICLRDEDGNRWFANVSVPSGNVMHFRSIYMAPVTIVEVTDTPTPVDP